MMRFFMESHGRGIRDFMWTIGQFVRMNFSRVVLKNWMIYAESLNVKIDRGNKSQKNKKV